MDNISAEMHTGGKRFRGQKYISFFFFFAKERTFKAAWDMWEMSCSFFGVGVGEQLFAISTEFTKGLHGEGGAKGLG